jgi:hypothetical protein
MRQATDLPALDLNASTLGYVHQVVRTPEGKIELIVSYSRWWGWFGQHRRHQFQNCGGLLEVLDRAELGMAIRSGYRGTLIIQLMARLRHVEGIVR